MSNSCLVLIVSSHSPFLRGELLVTNSKTLLIKTICKDEVDLKKGH